MYMYMYMDSGVHIYITCTDPKKLVLLDVVGSGSFGTVHRACWRGIVIAAKVIPVQCEVTSKEVELLR